MAPLKLVVKKTAGGPPFSVHVEPEISISELKSEVSKHADVPAEEQRLIYKGQILKDEKTVKDYGIEADHVLHLVRGRPAGSTSAPAASAAGATAAAGAAEPAAAAAAAAGIPTAGMAVPGGMPGMMGMDPQQMQQMMNSPIVQSLLDNPEFLRSMMQSNPAVRQMMDANPEVAQMMNNPQMLREAMRMATNPALMQEQMRNADRAMSNIESHPEGFNALRRMYETVQQPLESATQSGTDAAGGNATANPFAALFQPPGGASAAPPSEPATSGAPNAAPLPNPWAAPASGAPAAGTPAAGMGGTPDLSQMMGGMGGAGGMGGMGAEGAPDMNAMAQMMENPQMQEQMAAMLAMPGVMDAMISSNPQMQAAVQANPGLRQMLSNPEAVRQMMNPNALRQAMQLQQLMGGAGVGALPGAAGGQPATSAAPGTAPAGMPDFASMMNMMGGMGGMGGLGGMGDLGGGTPPVADPETAYATQIQQLVDMGFFDREANVRALQQTGGNVNAAVERLLAG